MPTLNEYADNSEQSGYYVRASVGGNSPITLQVSALAERLFLMLEFRPGDNLPTKFVWSMYDVGLLYTLKSMTSVGNAGDTDAAQNILEELDLDNELNSEREEKIIEQLEEYDGPDEQEVEELIERLRGSGRNYDRIQYADVDGDASLLLQWAEDPEHFLEIQESTEGFKEFADASIQTFARHPYLSAPPVRVTDEGAIQYHLNKADINRSVQITDCRFNDGYDYKVIIGHSEDRRETAKVKQSGHIVEYNNQAGKLGLRMQVSAMLDWILPDEKILVRPTTSSSMSTSQEISEYKGHQL